MASLTASGWSPSTALRPGTAILASFAYSLYILSAPAYYRLENVAIILVLSAIFEQSFGGLYPDDQLNVIFAHAVFIWLVHIVHVVLVRGDAGYIAGSSTQSRGQKPPDGGWTPVSAPGISRYHRAYKMLYNVRGIGMPWQVVKTRRPELSDEATDNQSRRRFLLRRIFIIVCRYFALAVFYEVSEPSMLVGPTGGSFARWIRLSGQNLLTFIRPSHRPRNRGPHVPYAGLHTPQLAVARKLPRMPQHPVHLHSKPRRTARVASAVR